MKQGFFRGFLALQRWPSFLAARDVLREKSLAASSVETLLIPRLEDFHQNNCLTHSLRKQPKFRDAIIRKPVVASWWLFSEATLHIT